MYLYYTCTPNIRINSSWQTSAILNNFFHKFWPPLIHSGAPQRRSGPTNFLTTQGSRTACTTYCTMTHTKSQKSYYWPELVAIPSGRSLCGCTRARHGEPSPCPGAKAAGNPRTEPSSQHLSACACDCRAALLPGSLEHIRHRQMSIHGVMNAAGPHCDGSINTAHYTLSM